MLVMLAQSSVGLVETYFVGKLGTDALAGVALVFPLLMLMQMMSAGAMGGGISSAIARALGAGRRADANALVVHALVIALVFGLAFTVALLGGGRWLYARDGRQRRLAASGADLLPCRLRRRHPGLAVQFARQCHPRHRQHDGAGARHLRRRRRADSAVAMPDLRPGTVSEARRRRRRRRRRHLLRGSAASCLPAICDRAAASSRLAIRGIRLRWPLFADILRVGLVAALITVQTNLTIAIATGLVGAFGPAAIAGYGTGSRLEYLLIPLVFGLGGPLVAMVGTNIGAGRRDRALRVAWIGAAIAAGLCEIIGFAAAAAPRAWLSLFDTAPAMIDAGSRYLHAVGPVYGLFGLGMALYFASQGAGRLLWPLLANMARLVIAAGGGWLALRWSGNLTDVFIALGGRTRRFRPDQCRCGRERRMVQDRRRARVRHRYAGTGASEKMTVRYLEDFAAGQVFNTGRLRVDKEQIFAFARQFDPQPFHLDEEAARKSPFQGLAASGWHTAALTMRLMVDGEFKPAGGILGVGFDELSWPRPVRPGDELHAKAKCWKCGRRNRAPTAA